MLQNPISSLFNLKSWPRPLNGLWSNIDIAARGLWTLESAFFTSTVPYYRNRAVTLMFTVQLSGLPWAEFPSIHLQSFMYCFDSSILCLLSFITWNIFGGRVTNLIQCPALSWPSVKTGVGLRCLALKSEHKSTLFFLQIVASTVSQFISVESLQSLKSKTRLYFLCSAPGIHCREGYFCVQSLHLILEPRMC